MEKKFREFLEEAKSTPHVVSTEDHPEHGPLITSHHGSTVQYNARHPAAVEKVKREWAAAKASNKADDAKKAHGSSSKEYHSAKHEYHKAEAASCHQAAALSKHFGHDERAAAESAEAAKHEKSAVHHKNKLDKM